MKTLTIIIAVLLFTGCSHFEMNSTEPIVKGASYIAYAIVTSAVIKAIFNK